MGEVILEKAVKKEEGYLYYVDREGNVCKVKMKRGGSKKDETKNRN